MCIKNMTMGMFSDHDVNRVVQIANLEPEWSEEQRIVFVDEFHKFWSILRDLRTENDVAKYSYNVTARLQRNYKNKLQTLFNDTKFFGELFGILIGIFRFHPQFVIKIMFLPKYTIDLLKILKTRASFAVFLTEVLRE